MSPGDGAPETTEDCGCTELATSGVQTFGVQLADGRWTNPVSGATFTVPGKAMTLFVDVLSSAGIALEDEAKVRATAYAEKLDAALAAGDWDAVFTLVPDFYAATDGLFSAFLDVTGTPVYTAASTAYDELENLVMALSSTADAVFVAVADGLVDAEEAAEAESAELLDLVEAIEDSRDSAGVYASAVDALTARRDEWAAQRLDGYRAPDVIGATEKPGNDDNWVDRTGGLPKYIKRIANHLIAQGMSKGHAIASAVNTVKRWARGGQNVKPDTIAKAQAALAEWEAKRAAAKAMAAQAAELASKAEDLTEAQAGVKQIAPLEGDGPFARGFNAKGIANGLVDPSRSADDEFGDPGEDLAEDAAAKQELVDGLTSVASAVLSVANDVSELVGLIPEGTRASTGHSFKSDVEALEFVARELQATARGAQLDSLVASAGSTIAVEVVAPVEPPKAWFDNPKFTAATPITVTPEGQVYGHLATWDACHMESRGLGTSCMRAPRSASNYSLFHTGYVRTAEGVDVPTGRLVADAPHADPAWDLPSTLVHYSHSGRAVADVRVGEDKYGIWVAGAMRPEVSKAQMRVLRASPLSGDWRTDPRTGRLELVTGLAVNVPGFMPRPRALVASVGTVSAMQAVGMLPPTQLALREGKPVLAADDVKFLRERKAAVNLWSTDAEGLDRLRRAALAAELADFAESRKIEELESFELDLEGLR